MKRAHEIRLSDSFVLGDFLGCNSVYLHGYANRFEDEDGRKLEEAKHLCETILEPLLDKYGPLSISYGYISPELSRRIVKYQDPNMPSYHRWDKGAAADVCLHHWVNELGKAPIFAAHEIDQELPYSRMITYSESPFICVASQLSEGDIPRRAFYENRYTGVPKAKPDYVRKGAWLGRPREAERIHLVHDWRGSGYPTYHGGGRKQYHHYRTSKYTVASDFLFNADAVEQGIPNVPDLAKVLPLMEKAGAVYDAVLESLDISRMHIQQAFTSRRVASDELFNWGGQEFALDFKPPDYVEVDDVMDCLLGLRHLGVVSASRMGGSASDSIARVVISSPTEAGPSGATRIRRTRPRTSPADVPPWE